MNDLAKTGIFVGGAAALFALALVSAPGSAEPVFFDDTGEEFFPDFDDPRDARALEVWEFDPELGEAIVFRVEQSDGLWTIPSHYQYPADAVERMGKAASLVIDLRKQKVITDDPKDHVELGVVDPTAPGLETEGRGTRVTFESGGGGALADLIIGEEAEGDIDLYYVREPDSKRVYAAKLSTDISTKFEDWIERDLLKASSWDLQEIVFDDYSVEDGRLVQGDKLVVTKDDSNQWVLEGLEEGEETDGDAVRQVVTALTDLEIVGVRPKPKGLTGMLEQASGFDRQILLSLLDEKGYFLGRDGKLYSNEGDLFAKTRKGVVYTLKFGEIVYGTGETVTSGQEAAEAGAQKEGEAAEQGPQPAAGNHRFLMITAEFDESLLEKPDGPRLSEEELEQREQAREQIEKIVAAVDAYREGHEGALPESLAVLAEGEEPPLAELPADPWGNDYVLETEEEGYVVVSHGADGAAGGDGKATDLRSDALAAEDELRAAAGEWESYDRKVEEGREEAAELAERFGPWYYVIDAEAFSKLKVDRAELVKEKAEPEEPAPDAGKQDGGPGNDK